MSKYIISNILTSPLPMWDSFEAVFFVIAGFSVGIVFGVLFPSIWRSFRRSFRKESRYAPKSEKWDDNLLPKLKILEVNDIENYQEKSEHFYYIHIYDAFTAARYFFQIGNSRKAISLYIDILTDEHVSKEDTNRALFELSQVYFSVGLFSRAFDTAFELLNRKPNQSQLLVYLLKICSKKFVLEKFNLALNTYKGIPDTNLRRTISHLICSVSESYFEKKDFPNAIDYARLALKWDRTAGRALVLLWQTTSQQFLQINSQDNKLKWLSFAADLEAIAQIILNNKISTAAGAEYLSKIIENLLIIPNSLEIYKQIEKEFNSTFSWEKNSITIQKKLLDAIFFSIILLQKRRSLNSFDTFVEILTCITNNHQAKIVEFLDYNKKYEPYIISSLLSHKCSHCGAFYLEFYWECAHCGLEEVLEPMYAETPLSSLETEATKEP